MSVAVAAIIVAAVAAVAAGAGAYMQSEAAAQQARDQKKMAKWQAEVERQQGEAARRQVQLRAQRMLHAQAAKAGKAGVVAGEGSLLENQLEAASLAQYEEDLAAYGHTLNSQTHGFESKLFGNRAKEIKSMQPVTTGLAFGGSALSSYVNSGGFKTPSSPTIATGI